MRIAIVSDIHGNRSPLEAVVARLRATTPDIVLHGASGLWQAVREVASFWRAALGEDRSAWLRNLPLGQRLRGGSTVHWTGRSWVRRVEYAVEQEVQALFDRGVPYAGWIARMLRTAQPHMSPTSAVST